MNQNVYEHIVLIVCAGIFFGWLIVGMAVSQQDDSRGPEVYEVSPAEGSTVYDRYTYFEFHYTDHDGSGVDLEDPLAIRVFVDGNEVTRLLKKTKDTVRYKPVLPWSMGRHAIEIRITDRKNNTESYMAHFSVSDTPESVPEERVPTVQPSPTVSFTPIPAQLESATTPTQYLKSEPVHLPVIPVPKWIPRDYRTPGAGRLTPLPKVFTSIPTSVHTITQLLVPTGTPTFTPSLTPAYTSVSFTPTYTATPTYTFSPRRKTDTPAVVPVQASTTPGKPRDFEIFPVIKQPVLTGTPQPVSPIPSWIPAESPATVSPTPRVTATPVQEKPFGRKRPSFTPTIEPRSWWLPSTSKQPPFPQPSARKTPPPEPVSTKMIPTSTPASIPTAFPTLTPAESTAIQATQIPVFVFPGIRTVIPAWTVTDTPAPTQSVRPVYEIPVITVTVTPALPAETPISIMSGITPSPADESGTCEKAVLFVTETLLAAGDELTIIIRDRDNNQPDSPRIRIRNEKTKDSETIPDNGLQMEYLAPGYFQAKIEVSAFENALRDNGIISVSANGEDVISIEYADPCTPSGKPETVSRSVRSLPVTGIDSSICCWYQKGRTVPITGDELQIKQFNIHLLNGSSTAGEYGSHCPALPWNNALQNISVACIIPEGLEYNGEIHTMGVFQVKNRILNWHVTLLEPGKFEVLTLFLKRNTNLKHDVIIVHVRADKASSRLFAIPVRNR